MPFELATAGFDFHLDMGARREDFLIDQFGLEQRRAGGKCRRRQQSKSRKQRSKGSEHGKETGPAGPTPCALLGGIHLNIFLGV